MYKTLKNYLESKKCFGAWGEYSRTNVGTFSMQALRYEYLIGTK
jgi:hypothetical protein